jgi:hypothetical protein
MSQYDHFEDIGQDEGVILKWGLKIIICNDVDYIHLVQDLVQWQAPV